MLLIRILVVGYIVIEICSSDSSPSHHRSRRIAKRRHRKKNGTDKSKIHSRNGSDESTPYPDDFFLPPTATEVSDTYDYDKEKFNKPYLTQVEWKSDITNRTHHYKLKQKDEGGIQLQSIVKPVEPVAPIGVIEPISAISLFR